MKRFFVKIKLDIAEMEKYENSKIKIKPERKCSQI